MRRNQGLGAAKASRGSSAWDVTCLAMLEHVCNGSGTPTQQKISRGGGREEQREGLHTLLSICSGFNPCKLILQQSPATHFETFLTPQAKTDTLILGVGRETCLRVKDFKAFCICFPSSLLSTLEKMAENLQDYYFLYFLTLSQCVRFPPS